MTCRESATCWVLGLAAWCLIASAHAAGPKRPSGVAAIETWQVMDARAAPWPGLVSASPVTQIGGVWQLDDVRYADGSRLGQLLN